MYLKADNNHITVPGTNKNLQYLQFMDLSYNKLRSTDYINHGRLKHLILNSKIYQSVMITELTYTDHQITHYIIR